MLYVGVLLELLLFEGEFVVVAVLLVLLFEKLLVLVLNCWYGCLMLMLMCFNCWYGCLMLMLMCYCCLLYTSPSPRDS